MKKVQIGIVGAGLIGETHIKAFQLNPLCEVAAICDPNQARLDEMKTLYGIPQAYTSQQAMHAACALDGVVIATPDNAHLEPVKLAAAAGVHILLEKPIATTREDALAIIQATRQAGVKLMLGMTLRYMPTYVHIQEQFSNGVLGEPINAFTKRVAKKSEAHRLNGRCSVNAYLGVHDIDFLLSIFGREVDTVYATRGDFEIYDSLGVADYYWNVLKWKNGATAVAQVTWNEPEGYKNLIEMECNINGTKGSAQLKLAGQQLAISTDTYADRPELSLDSGYPIEADHFIKCIVSDAMPHAGGQEGLDALTILLAAEQSIDEGRPVRVELGDQPGK